MNAAELWGAAGLLLGIAELIAPGVFLLWIGLAALGTGALAAVVTIGWPAQLAAFAGLAVILVAIAFRRVRRPGGGDLVNAPGAGLIGSHCTAIEFRAGLGRVRIRDGTWQARIAGQDPAPGIVLRVVGLEGTTLLVEKVTA